MDNSAAEKEMYGGSDANQEFHNEAALLELRDVVDKALRTKCLILNLTTFFHSNQTRIYITPLFAFLSSGSSKLIAH